MKTWLTILTTTLTLTCCFSATAWADYLPEGATQRDAVDSAEVLASYISSQDFIASRLELRKYSPDVVGDLVELVSSRRVARDTRARAIKCLALYRQDERATAELERLFERTSKRSKLYPQIIVSFMEQRGEDAAERVAPLLSSSNRTLRLAAVIALGRFGGQTGYEQLLEAEQLEQDTQVLERISRYTH